MSALQRFASGPGLPEQPAAKPLAVTSFKPSFRDVTNLLAAG
jgi:hypothetical protein